MKNYKDSDYALNKHSEGIVYQFSDGSKQTIWLADYLTANPDKTAEDFVRLKALSDELYHAQVVVEHRTSRLDVTLNDLEETEALSTLSRDKELQEKENRNTALKAALKAATLLLDSNDLTEIQRRRFLLHFMQGLSYRQIAEQEGVFFTSVAESVSAATTKLKKYFKNF